MVRRATPVRFWNCRMSSISISAWSILEPAGLHVGAVEALDEILVEHRLHRLDGRERFLELLEQRHIQHAGLDRGFVAVVLENVPGADFEVFQLGQRDEILDCGAAAIGALAQADGAQLGERADRACRGRA